jgi:polysaccharide deacetylase 2 family uncharacterized protein YibQ
MAGKLLGLLTAILVASSSLAEFARPKIAIIIDDLGYERRAGERAIALPGPVTYAVLPGTPRARQLSEVAFAAGKEVILHLPMQAESGDEPVDPGSLHLDMSRSEFGETLADNIEAVPHIIGINGHRGSLLTRHPGHMQWLMDEIRDRQPLFFVDSYTTPESVALHIAAENGVPAIKRDVFLDPDADPETVNREFARLKKLAEEQGFAVGIGHPYPATLGFLEKALPALEADGFELVSVSTLVGVPARNAVFVELPSAE